MQLCVLLAGASPSVDSLVHLRDASDREYTDSSGWRVLFLLLALLPVWLGVCCWFCCRCVPAAVGLLLKTAKRVPW